MNDSLITVENVSKKFCRELKRSLRYGVYDLVKELLGQRQEGLVLRKKEFWAIKDVGFELKRGEVLGLIGPNGAGKTTLLRMLNGLIKPDAGRITVRGRVGALIQLGAGFNPVLTGLENIYINAAILGIPKKEIDHKLDSIIEFADLGEFMDAPVQSYSSGMVVRLGFSVAINLKPDIMLVDEVLAVGDIAFRNKCLDAIQAIRGSGVAFVFVSHNLEQVDRLCDKAVFLKGGRLAAIGPTADVISAYVQDSTQTKQAQAKTTIYHVPGTEKFMQVLDVLLLDNQGQQVEQIVSGTPLTIQMTFEARQTMESPLFMFIIEPLDRRIIAAYVFQDRLDNLHSFEPGVHTIQTRLPKFSLLAGSYVLRGGVYSKNLITLYGKYANLAAISVSPRHNQMVLTNSSGCVELESHWQVVN
jgi:lipopolysaccharide transport system ATP-binding protein